MPKRRQILLVLAAGALVLGLYAILSRPPEPSYKGRSLSAWQTAYPWDTTTNLSRQQEVDDAIRHMGTNTLPFLLKWIRLESPVWKTTVWSKMPDWAMSETGARWMFHREIKAYRAALALKALGPEADAAIPALAAMLKDAKSNYQTRQMAAMALAQVGTKQAFQALTAALTNGHGPDRVIIISALVEVGTNALPTVPTVLECIKDADPDLGAYFTKALRQIAPVALTNAPPK